jgi:hypothetical protein
MSAVMDLRLTAQAWGPAVTAGDGPVVIEDWACQTSMPAASQYPRPRLNLECP